MEKNSTMKERKEELIKLVNNDVVLTRTIEEMVILEERLDYLKTLPFIKVHPDDVTKQKATPASKLYRELLQQYTTIVRIMMRATGTDEQNEESPLRKWFRENMEE